MIVSDKFGVLLLLNPITHSTQVAVVIESEKQPSKMTVDPPLHVFLVWKQLEHYIALFLKIVLNPHKLFLKLATFNGISI